MRISMSFQSCVIVLGLCFPSLYTVLGAPRIREFIGHYEPLYRQGVISFQNDEKSKFHVDFEAFHRIFLLNLETNSEILPFFAKVIIHEENGERSILSSKSFKRNLVTGVDTTFPNSAVRGIMVNGIFNGIIKTNGETYYVESSQKFFDRPPAFESVIYRKSDVKPTRNVSEFCSVESETETIRTKRFVFSQFREAKKAKKKKSVVKICQLKLVSDHTFYQQTAHEHVQDTISEMAFLVTEADKIFRNTDFSMTGVDTIGLQIAEIEIFKSAITKDLYDESINIVRYKKEFSKLNFDKFCLGVAFTSRDFNRMLGMTTIPSPEANGGICFKSIVVNGVKLSYNTVVFTVLGRDSSGRSIRTPRNENIWALTHELGHAFGAEHDDQFKEQRPECFPSNDKGGKFLMHSGSLGGNFPNNLQFSECSLRSFKKIVNNKDYSGCFADPVSLCGNGVIEGDEECDCSSSELCSEYDPCCNPPDSPDQCKLKAGKQCTPKDGLCCSSECNFVAPSAEVDCTEGNDCLESATCSGKSKDCPKPKLKPENSKCDNELGRCQGGFCHDHACGLMNMKRCVCETTEQLCSLCCLGVQDPNKNAIRCFIMLNNVSRNPYLFQDGKICDDGRGSCSSGVCVDHSKGENPIKKRPAQNLEDSDMTLWIGLGVGLVIVVFIIILILVCAFCFWKYLRRKSFLK